MMYNGIIVKEYKMLTFHIDSASIQESNIFLRKLWSEFNEITPMGWNLCSYKENNKVFIGVSAVGEISYDYTRRGCIKNLYVENTKNADDISIAVQRAKNNSMKEYVVCFELENDKGISVADTSIDNCKIYSDKEKTYLYFNFEAYSAWDMKMYLPNKYTSVISILYEYTRVLFKIKKIEYASGNLSNEVSEPKDYDYGWMDYDDYPHINDRTIIIPHECLKLISYVMNDRSYDENIELLLNSGIVLMSTQSMLQEIEFPYLNYKSDIINSMACSSFEPLSLILDKNNERCDKCGNMVFSIMKKVKKMCTLYFNENFSKYMFEDLYKKRSAFLHAGEPESMQDSSRIFCPQIHPKSGVVMMPHGRIRYDVFDYSSYLFRNIAHDYYNGTLYKNITKEERIE